MPITSILTRNSETLFYLELDAVLEETIEASAELTAYPIETGVQAVDHRVLQPIKWIMTGGLSNNPARVRATDFTGLLSDLVDQAGPAGQFGFGQFGLGVAAGFLSGPDETRASEALYLILNDLWANGTVFDVNTGDITLLNMSVTKVTRTNSPDNDGALIFQVEMQELPTLDRIREGGNAATRIQPTTDPNDESSRSIGRRVNHGLVQLREISDELREEALALIQRRPR